VDFLGYAGMAPLILAHFQVRKNSMEEIVGEPSAGLDIEDMAVFQKTTKGNRPTKILGGCGEMP